MRIKYVIGDATRPKGEGNKIICHVCNNVGAWGAGFVLALSSRWKAPEESYRDSAENRELVLGKVIIVPVEEDIVVANMVAQHSIYPDQDGLPPIRYGALRTALTAVNDLAVQINGTLHMPRIGCGLAGGRWSDVEQIIKDVVTVNVTVYDLK
jgi:O-acetyl-ADP-ribose deacetylase (regulator of RNase III)